MNRRTTVIALVAILALSACGQRDGVDIPGTPTVAPTTFLPTSIGTKLNEGTSHVELSGGIELTLDLPLMAPSVYNSPPGGAAISFGDTAGNALGIAGLFEDGPTSSDLVITITRADPITLLLSSSGECTVAFEAAADGSVDGTFDCTDIPGAKDGPTDATGTFETSI